MATSPPVVDGSNESNVVEQSVHGADLCLLGRETIALDHRRKLRDAGHYGWKSGEDRDDGAVVRQHREHIRLDAPVQRFDFWDQSPFLTCSSWRFTHTLN